MVECTLVIATVTLPKPLLFLSLQVAIQDLQTYDENVGA
jgi:hypothetical protein